MYKECGPLFGHNLRLQKRSGSVFDGWVAQREPVKRWTPDRKWSQKKQWPEKKKVACARRNARLLTAKETLVVCRYTWFKLEHVKSICKCSDRPAALSTTMHFSFSKNDCDPNPNPDSRKKTLCACDFVEENETSKNVNLLFYIRQSLSPHRN